MASEHIFYFEDKATIGFCPLCDEFAVYTEGEGLHCPGCGTKSVSYFVWDGESRHPEDDEIAE